MSGRINARAEYEQALALHLSTWGTHCGAKLAVYEGHLNKLLEAHAAMVRESIERTVERYVEDWRAKNG